ncbi:MAG TPA: DJ-1/PfpI family protein [Candidatus Saccharimonadales bacterium]|nr:DJ-1/PfpI family protein [Candidatus Saccharimonadales bacterium]
MKNPPHLSPVVLLALACLAPLFAGDAAASLKPPPPEEHISVAFVLTDGAVMLDFAGPWEVFQDVHIPSRGSSMEEQMPFRLFTVSDTKDPIRISSGMCVIPDYSFADAPAPNVVVVPAQNGDSPQMLEWIRSMTRKSDVVMSVCTGAFVLGEAGVLDGKKATTHHGAYYAFQRQFPKVQLQEGMRYVQSDPVNVTAGGLSSGIDLALHILDLYFGRDVAEATARHMEYEGEGWKGDGRAAESFSQPVAPGPHPSDAVAKGVLGSWKGTLDAIEGPLHIALHLWRDEDGRLIGTVDDPADDVTNAEMKGLSFTAPSLHFDVDGLSNSFDGTLSTDESAITGTWVPHHGSLPVTFTRVHG